VLKYLITIWMLLCGNPGWLQAQETFDSVQKEIIVVPTEDYVVEQLVDDEEEVLTIDTILAIRTIKISTDSVRFWKNKKEFSYLSNLDSLLKADRQQQQSPQQTKGPKMKAGSPDTSFLKGLMWILAITFILFVVYQLLQNKGLFKGSSRKLTVEEIAEPQQEDILEMDIDQLLRKAEQQADYRLATRYQYIKTLQFLNDKQWIDFAADKTNRQYLYEIPEQKRSEFSRLILNYEYVWFGNTTIDHDLYKKITTLHGIFNSSM